MTPKFQIGDWLWIAQVHYTQKEETCPICAGYKVVYIRSTNGDEWEMDCRYCSPGYDPPTGVVKVEYEYADKPLRKQVSGVQISQGEVRYTFGHHHSGTYTEDEVFEDKSDAADRAAEIAEKQTRDRQDGDERRKANDRKSYAWHVGYYQRQAKKARKDYDRALRKARYMGTKVRKPKE